MVGRLSFLLMVALAASKEVLRREIFAEGEADMRIRKTNSQSKFNSHGSRMVGGNEATDNSYPHQAALIHTRDPEIWFCGGALIHPEWVLSSAACTPEDDVNIEVVLGAHNRSDPTEPNRVSVMATQYIKHPNWTQAAQGRNDICLIQLSAPVTLNEYVNVIELDQNDPPVGEMITLTGWGQESDSDPNFSEVLKELTVPVISNADCALDDHRVFDGTICTDGSGGVGACSHSVDGGDMGGPGNWFDPALGYNVTVGVINFGDFAGCEVGLPTVMARVSYFQDWILSVIGG